MADVGDCLVSKFTNKLIIIHSINKIVAKNYYCMMVNVCIVGANRISLVVCMVTYACIQRVTAP